MAFYFVSTFANAQTPTKQRPYGYRGLKIFTSLKLRFQDFQRRKSKNKHAQRPLTCFSNPTDTMFCAHGYRRAMLPHEIPGLLSP
ncbi:hypothetical protein [Bathymodiolus japonicus methanotrophic gill symbiont]|uniref:hypothetical protein n=1 Tax=Bathymodiolus japonicus methanotrophic gill symbiont TaxID=113269 RepID=UPI001C8E69B2|nr:hypothetical protein [Bathymodiolus japonicus methanotrophic gill symbiont]